MSPPRVLFHVQHLLGIGHWRRAVAIARALDQVGMAVTMLSGGPPEAAPPGIDIVQLPPVFAADASFALLYDADGRPIDDAFRANRRALVLAAFARCRPQVLLIESFPFGRRAFAYELLPLIAAARGSSPRPAILASIRDILVERNDPERARSIVDRVRRDFDAVLVHGDPALVTLEASFALAAELAPQLRYTGYVVAEDGGKDDGAGAGEVIVSVGGGAVGARLLRIALATRALSPLAAAPWRLLTGPHLPDGDFRALVDAAEPGVVVERFRPNLGAMLSRCRLSISQAGYNTTLDVLRAGARAIVVPFAAERETEQTRRSELLAKRGVLHMLGEDALTPQSLARAIAECMGAAPRPRLRLNTDGAVHTARLLADFAVGCAAGKG